MIEGVFRLIATALTLRKYFKSKSFISISSLFIATNVINNINFWKTGTFLMGVNVSNKEYYLFIVLFT